MEIVAEHGNLIIKASIKSFDGAKYTKEMQILINEDQGTVHVCVMNPDDPENEQLGEVRILFYDDKDSYDEDKIICQIVNGDEDLAASYDILNKCYDH